LLSIDLYKKETVHIPLFLYLLILAVYKVSCYFGLVELNGFVERFSIINALALFVFYLMYRKDKISYNIFIGFFVFSITIVLSFVVYYNIHVSYRAMWVISLIPFVFLYSGKKIGVLFSVYFLFFVIFAYLEGLFPKMILQDLYVYIFSNLLVASISYFFITKLEENVGRFEQTHKSLEVQAYTDALTGVYNRRGFNKAVKDKKGVLGIFDLDDFKRINDTYGHKFGDEYLRFFAELLKQNVHLDDIIGRIGGDEFIVLFNNAKISDVKKWCLHFYETLEKNPVNQNMVLSVSCGFSEYKDDFNLSYLEADNLLYHAKTKKCTFKFPS